MIEFIEPDVARAKKCHGIFRLYGDLCAIDVCVEFEVLTEIRSLWS